MLIDSPVRTPTADAVPASSLHAAFRSAERWERLRRRSAIRLQVGEPAYPMPPAVVDAMARTVRTGNCAYTGAEGSPELRAGLTERLRSRGVDAAPDRVFVTPGSCQGLWAVLTSLVTPGAAVLIPELHWPIYRQQAILTGFTPIGYPLRSDFTPDPDGIAAAAAQAGGRVSAIVVNSPANPTGAVAGEADLRAVLELADRHDWTLISDEAYEEFCYRGRHHPAAALEADRPGRQRRVFSTYSFSKSHAMTGCRVGYVTAPDDRRADVLRRVQEACIIAPPTPAQAGALAGLSADREVAVNSAFVRANLDAVADRLRAGGVLAAAPAGGWYAVLDVSAGGLAAQEFAESLLDATGVCVAPASAFAFPGDDRASGLIRISLAGPTDELRIGVGAVLDHVRRLRAGQRR